MKGILLAGGTGSRLFPTTFGVSKHLLPVYDKPMIYYPLSVLMLAGIREILLISTAQDVGVFRRLLGTGADFGIQLSYAVQQRPDGLAQALTIGETFCAGEAVCLVLGDNVFYGAGFGGALQAAAANTHGATVFAKQVPDPQRFGVVSFDETGQARDLQEKPVQPVSDWAVAGLYFYDGGVADKVRSLRPSARGELEITDLNRLYLQEGLLRVQTLGRGFVWLDAGTPESLHQASAFVRTVQQAQQNYIACLEEIAWRKGWLSTDGLAAAARRHAQTAYGDYLAQLCRSATSLTS
ncbi:glucose-1-phosphate thymidylyltransferase RfbA [Conchiformibius steedae DSM 2580]|uniref:Glucose-1-phosphate thymidylyltransferase n=1 Tax=Conchiformibius steedae DSM 2580 TaxID=1121352 RepID=A0AAE9HWF6_9NEIS|nr:glucose-1-phosphate thymidylyltransferase RfbA [Conchiformibius steedae]QMT33133.1 glucose-1-phosphate thymidylyltransferase RfbA [Conchiformibius steedae]URD67766.1 glucose-1-phosphate thymidylyltransferase RfbA [Conchiformibius steedae DSM 2580]